MLTNSPRLGALAPDYIVALLFRSTLRIIQLSVLSHILTYLPDFAYFAYFNKNFDMRFFHANYPKLNLLRLFKSYSLFTLITRSSAIIT